MLRRIAFAFCLVTPATSWADAACTINPLGWSQDGTTFVYQAQRSYSRGTQDALDVTVGVVLHAYHTDSQTYVLNPNSTDDGTVQQLSAYKLDKPAPQDFAGLVTALHPKPGSPRHQGRWGKADIVVKNGTGSWQEQVFHFIGKDEQDVVLTPVVLDGNKRTIAGREWRATGRKKVVDGVDDPVVQPAEGDVRAYISPDGAHVAWIFCKHGYQMGEEVGNALDNGAVSATVSLEGGVLDSEGCNVSKVLAAYPAIKDLLKASSDLHPRNQDAPDSQVTFSQLVAQAQALRNLAKKKNPLLLDVVCGGDDMLNACLKPLNYECEGSSPSIAWSYFAPIPKTPEEALAFAVPEAALDGPANLFGTCCGEGDACVQGGVALPQSFLKAESLTALVALGALDTPFGNVTLDTWKKSGAALDRATCSCESMNRKGLAKAAEQITSASQTLTGAPHEQALKPILQKIAARLQRGLPKARCDLGAGLEGD